MSTVDDDLSEDHLDDDGAPLWSRDHSGCRLHWWPSGRAADGTWWPRSDDLLTELADLLPLVSGHVGSEINHLSLHLGDWPDSPQLLHVHGHQVRLGWFHQLDPHVLTLGHGLEARTVLQVVPSALPA
jgi:hypothetical protein